MPQQSQVFPIHIRAEYRDSQQAFTRFQADVGKVTTFAKNEFERSGQEISNLVKNALTLPRNAAGSLNLGSEQLAEAARDAQAYALSLKDVERAANKLAKETGDTSAETRLFLQAANAASREAEESARSLTAQAATYERLQREIDQTTAATKRQISAQNSNLASSRAATKSAGAQRFAMVQIGQQFQDVAIQMQTNTRLSTIFVQQGSQLAFAMSGLGGKLGNVARILAGPLGAAVFGAVTAFSLLRSTTDDNAEASKRAQSAGEELARSQLDIANFFDTATGAINEQNQSLIQNAILKRQDLEQEIESRLKERTKNFIGTAAASTQVRADSRSKTGFVQSNDIRDALRTANPAKALAEVARSNSVNANLAEKLSDRLAGIATDAKELRKIQKEISSLETGTLANDLRTGFPKKARTAKSGNAEAKAAAREIERLSRVSEQSAEAIARINSQFDDQPKLVDRSTAAVRKLDSIISELNNDKNGQTPRLAELLEDANEARALADNAVSNQVNRQIEQSEESLRIQTLLVQGKIEEADIAGRIASFEDQFGLQAKIQQQRETLSIQQDILDTSTAGTAEYDEARKIIDETAASLDKNVQSQRDINEAVRSQVIAEERINELGQIRQEQLSRYDTAIGSVRGELEALFSGDGTDFLKNIGNTFKQLQAETNVEAIFGSAFRDLEKALRRNTPLGRAETALEDAMTKTGDVAIDLGNNFVTVSNLLTEKVIPGLNEAIQANQPAGSTGVAANDNVIAVNGQRIEAEIGIASMRDFSRGIAEAVTFPLLDKFDETFGTSFFSQMNAVLSSAVAGYLTAGPVGAALGGLQQVVGDLTSKGGINEALGAKISEGLGKALGGAQTGAQTAQLLQGLGIKTSSTGGAIGGAIGSAVPIPGGEIVGSILGSLVGGLFKGGAKTARANITGVDSISVAGADSSNFGAANTLAGAVISGLENVADTLNARIGSFNTTIGTRGDDFRVNTNGTSLKIKNGARDFGEDEAAAVSFAIFDAISDGAIIGLRAGTERLLKAAGDIQEGLQDALDFENVFNELEQRKDPLGFSLKSLNREFEGLIDLFKRAGASAEEFASLEELYGLERADIIAQASEQFTETLKGFLDDLTIGDNGLSVRDRLGSALDRFNPLAADVRAGGEVDAGQFEEAARAVLELERQVFGSQGNYFSRLDEITNLTEQALQSEQDRLTAAANDNQGITFAIDSQTDTLSGYLEAINRGNSDILQAIQAGSGFFGPTLNDRFAVNNF
ncbi:hypothetical protein [Parasphingorhabdus sp.]|uniref:hypothetical protein n=1 Tax=Parasphingorhabdus sp. TaxID=2709688 RepID=UPI003BAEC5E7